MPLLSNFIKGSVIPLKGFVTLRHDIAGMSLAEIESILGFKSRTFEYGAVVCALESFELEKLANGWIDFEYFGDTRIPEHHFEKYKNKNLTKNDQKQNILAYLKIRPEIVKIFAKQKNQFGTTNPDELYPIGYGGAMQLKLNQSLSFKIISIIDDYPYGRFMN